MSVDAIVSMGPPYVVRFTLGPGTTGQDMTTATAVRATVSPPDGKRQAWTFAIEAGGTASVISVVRALQLGPTGKSELAEHGRGSWDLRFYATFPDGERAMGLATLNVDEEL